MQKLTCLLLCLSLASTVVAQGGRKGEVKGRTAEARPLAIGWSKLPDELADRDPYAAMDGPPTGVTSFVGEDPKQVEATMKTRVLWLETPHFRIGSTLPAFRLQRGQPHSTSVAAELASLRKTLPLVPSQVDVLDPWLRLHLFGQRLEDLRRETAELFDATAKDWPQGKQEVLLLDQMAELQRFGNRYLGQRPQQSIRHHFPTTGILFLGIACDAFGDTLRHDRTLHAHLAYNAMANLIDGYRGYQFNIPVWLKVGLGQVHAKRIDPDGATFEQDLPVAADTQMVRDWPRLAWTLVQAEDTTPAETALGWFDVRPMKIKDTIACWSRVEFLLAVHRKAFPDFIRGLKTPRAYPAPTPSEAVVLQRQAAALESAFGFTASQFDQAWRDHVRSHMGTGTTVGAIAANGKKDKNLRNRQR